MGRLTAVSRLRFATLVVMLLSVGISYQAAAQAQQQQEPPLPTWRDTGIVLPGADLRVPGGGYLQYHRVCFDSVQPNIIYMSDDKGGIVSYNWATAEHAHVTSLPYRFCAGENRSDVGNGKPNDSATGFRFPEQVDASPLALEASLAQDGTRLAYKSAQGVLQLSTDGGATWNPRHSSLDGQIGRVVPSVADARALYTVVQHKEQPEPNETAYSIYFSPDGGLTWQERYRGEAFYGGYRTAAGISLAAIPNAPVDVIFLMINSGVGGGSSYHTEVYVSGDGARSFRPAWQWQLSRTLQIVHTREGLLRLDYSFYGSKGNQPAAFRPILALSTDGGKSWQALPDPPLVTEEGGFIPVGSMSASISAPNNVFISQGSAPLLWSHDGGRSWRKIESDVISGGAIAPIHITPYLPLSVLGTRGGHLYVLDIPQAGNHLSEAALPNGSPGGAYFKETGHNLSGLFGGYWQTHGGLAQQGYPITEPFMEVSATEGKVYLVQYFQRAVFEYHPENKPPYDVLLSLLGVRDYRSRYPAGAPDQAPTSDAGAILFPETAHRLGGAFLSYWQSHGGLSQQGYPITEEFQAKSPLDGKTYTMQYFERAVFELHP